MSDGAYESRILKIIIDVQDLEGGAMNLPRKAEDDDTSWSRVGGISISYFVPGFKHRFTGSFLWPKLLLVLSRQSQYMKIGQDRVLPQLFYILR